MVKNKKYLPVLAAVSLAAAVVFAFPVNPQPIGVPGSWDIVFQDEFDGTTLDLAKWRPNWLGSTDTSITKPINSAELSCYDPANVKVQGGELLLTAEKRPCSTWAWASGIVQSYSDFKYTYGFAEARIWMPAGAGVWPAFWTDGAGLNWPTTGEIDVVECYGTDASCSYHYHYSGGGPGGNKTVAGSTAGWHTYAANWEPGKITWYYDGVQVWQYTTGIISVPHFLIANLGVKGAAPNPSVMRVDYIRVWKPGIQQPASPTTTSTPILTTVTRTSTPTNTPTLTSLPSATGTPTLTPSPIATVCEVIEPETLDRRLLICTK